MIQSRGRCFRSTAALAFWLLASSGVHAQTTKDVSAERSFQNGFDADTLSALPLGENVYALLETTQSEMISDRFSSGGLNLGQGARIGGFLGSWSQTRFRIGDIDVTDPTGSGASLLFPELMFWQRVTIGSGMFSGDTIAPGLAVDLEPRRPAAKWTSTLSGSGSGGSLASQTPAGLIPPIMRLGSWGHGAAMVSGPLSPRVGLSAGGTWSRSSAFAREVAQTTPSSVASGVANLVYSASANTEARVFGWFQRASAPLDYRRILPAAAPTRDRSTHLQATWQNRRDSGLSWRVATGYTERARTNDLGTTSVTFERLIDGPVPALVAASADDTTRRWTLAARITPAPATTSRHTLDYGFDADRAGTQTTAPFSGVVGETVDGLAARAWRFVDPRLESKRHRVTVAAFANDRIAISPTLTLDASLRLESVTGSAAGAANGVRWLSVLPRAAFRWKVTDLAQLSLVAGYRRSANQLNLDLLSFGDPAASTGTVSRWTGAPLTAAPAPGDPVIDRIGPGTGGDPAFSRIDANLKRPYTDEFVVGVESHRDGWLKWGLMGIGRHETNIIGLTDVGVPLSAYTAGTQFDPGQVLDLAFDDQQLPVYNRLPSTFGNNRYLLTNPVGHTARSFALKLTAQATGQRFYSLWVGTTYLAQGSAGNRGFGPLENDQDAVGERFTNPNAAGFARGRLFADRAFTIKWTTAYKLPGDLDLGVIARYQDGQPMSRLVIASGLTQGPEALLAYPNASHRYTFTGTLDLRVRKGIAVGTRHADLVLDAYNLVTRSNEVEEYAVTGPDFRASTAIEPTPAVHLGLRLSF
ncbi:MAG: TonB-dependent receptor [Vicinamibacterales bacterium]